MKIMMMMACWLFPLLAIGQNLDVKLLNIRYYNGDCGPSNPIKVRVCFAAPDINPQSTTMVIKYDNSATLTKEVTEADDEGNIYYSFCSKEGETTNFQIFFRDKNGKTSNNFAISATP